MHKKKHPDDLTYLGLKLGLPWESSVHDMFFYFSSMHDGHIEDVYNGHDAHALHRDQVCSFTSSVIIIQVVMFANVNLFFDLP